MKALLILLFPCMLAAGEAQFLKVANKKCGSIKNEKEKAACVTGTFLDYCHKNKGLKFCKKEALRADYIKRTQGAKRVLRLAYKNVKKNNGVLNLKEIFRGGTKQAFYYIFGVPKKCKSSYIKGGLNDSASLHGLFTKIKEPEKKLIETLNKLNCPKKGTFRVYAIGQIDEDPKLDIWYVDNKKRIKHYQSDLKK